jgi:hypothetical protein
MVMLASRGGRTLGVLLAGASGHSSRSGSGVSQAWVGCCRGAATRGYAAAVVSQRAARVMDTVASPERSAVQGESPGKAPPALRCFPIRRTAAIAATPARRANSAQAVCAYQPAHRARRCADTPAWTPPAIPPTAARAATSAPRKPAVAASASISVTTTATAERAGTPARPAGGVKASSASAEAAAGCARAASARTGTASARPASPTAPPATHARTSAAIPTTAGRAVTPARQVYSAQAVRVVRWILAAILG